MVSCGIDRDLLVCGITENHHNMLTTIYYLIAAKNMSEQDLDELDLNLEDVTIQVEPPASSPAAKKR